MGEQWNASRASQVATAVEEGGHLAPGGADPRRTQRFVPDVEEIAERVGADNRRLDVDDPVGCVRVQPEKRRTADRERSSRGRCDLERRRDADPAGSNPWSEEIGASGRDAGREERPLPLALCRRKSPAAMAAAERTTTAPATVRRVRMRGDRTSGFPFRPVRAPTRGRRTDSGPDPSPARASHRR